MRISFGSFHEFILMGGYSYYVWSAVLLSMLLLLALLFIIIYSKRKLFQQVRLQQFRESRRKCASNNVRID